MRSRPSGARPARTLAVQNTKNATERSYTVQKMLADAGMNAGVTISLQSTDQRTLKAVKRDNISLELVSGAAAPLHPRPASRPTPT